MKEAVAWLGYTYLYVRMKQNPLSYGIPWDELAADPELLGGPLNPKPYPQTLNPNLICIYMIYRTIEIIIL